MSNTIQLDKAELSMTTLEVSNLAKKRHDNVIRDLKELENQGVLALLGFEEREKYGNNNERTYYRLPKRETLILTSGYSAIQRAAIIDRWIELEGDQAVPEIKDPALAATVQALVEIDSVKQRTEVLEQAVRSQTAKNDQLDTAISRLEIDTRNGVPSGYISKKHAHRMHSRGLSREIFEQALTVLEVSTQKYVHTENGYSSHSIAWEEAAIEPAVNRFIDDAVQVTPSMCESPMLNGKRFRFVKEVAA